MKAYVSVTCFSDKVDSAHQAIQQLEGIVSAEKVTGPIDIIVTIESDNPENLGKLVLPIREIDGVMSTSTAVVFNL